MAPIPESIISHQQSCVLELVYAQDKRYKLSYEFLRVHSPSAEVQGHGQGQQVLQTGKREVGINALEPVGNYAVQPTFSDGHDSGIFSWEYLYYLGAEQARLWSEYESRLKQAGMDRDAPMAEKAAQGCGHHH